MIVALVLFIIIFIFFAFFIGKNLSNVCNFWLFKSFEQLPVSVLVLVAFAMGIAFSVLIFAVFKIRQSTKVDAETAAAMKAAKEEKSNARAAKRKERLEKKEKALRENKASAVNDKPNGADQESDDKSIGAKDTADKN